MKKLFTFFILCIGVAFAFELPDYYKKQPTDKTVEVFKTRGDKQIAIRWLADSKDNDGAILVALNGGHGKWGLIDGHITSSRLASTMASFSNYRAFSLDTPSDEYKKGEGGGYGNEVYRLSKMQIDDLKAALEAVNKTNAPVYVITTSKSALSAANIASAGLANIKGVVLTAVSADLTKLAPFMKTRSLWIHHQKDICFNIGIQNVKNMSKLAKDSSMLEVTNESIVSGKECAMTNYHGFPQRDLALAQAIDAWINGKKISTVLP